MFLFFLISYCFAAERVLFLSGNPKTINVKSGADLTDLYVNSAYLSFDTLSTSSLQGWSNFNEWKEGYSCLTTPRIVGDYFYYLYARPPDSAGVGGAYSVNRANLLTGVDDVFIQNIPCTYQQDINCIFKNFQMKRDQGISYLQTLISTSPNNRQRIHQVPMSLLNDTNNEYSQIPWTLTVDFPYTTPVFHNDFILQNYYTNGNLTNRTYSLSLKTGLMFLPASEGAYTTVGLIGNNILPMPIPTIPDTYSKVPYVNGAGIYVFPNETSSGWTMYVINPLTDTNIKPAVLSTFVIPGMPSSTWKIDSVEIDPEFNNIFYVVANQNPSSYRIIQLLFDGDGVSRDLTSSPNLLKDGAPVNLLNSRIIVSFSSTTGEVTKLNVAKKSSIFKASNNGTYSSTTPTPTAIITPTPIKNDVTSLGIIPYMSLLLLVGLHCLLKWL